jgi:hypothetical protein
MGLFRSLPSEFNQANVYMFYILGHYEPQGRIELFAVAVSAASLVVSILAFLRASSTEQRSLADAKTQAFLTFCDRFNAIKRDIPPGWSDRNWLPDRALLSGGDRSPGVSLEEFKGRRWLDCGNAVQPVPMPRSS